MKFICKNGCFMVSVFLFLKSIHMVKLYNYLFFLMAVNSIQFVLPFFNSKKNNIGGNK